MGNERLKRGTDRSEEGLEGSDRAGIPFEIVVKLCPAQGSASKRCAALGMTPPSRKATQEARRCRGQKPDEAIKGVDSHAECPYLR